MVATRRLTPIAALAGVLLLAACSGDAGTSSSETSAAPTQTLSAASNATEDPAEPDDAPSETE